ncbi:hypothetical protein ABMA27_003371 [Loxostege sticticalis]|uniref:Uncharacterized protein n=1 Tax=Loxostege sticticalis TaxID=481309 RepID=A0ABR3HSZ5_LOXSC
MACAIVAVLSATKKIVRPFPKAAPRKTRGARSKKSTIYTVTPEKEAIRQTYEERTKRLKAKQVKKNLTGQKGIAKGKGKTKAKNKITSPSTSEEDEYFCLICVSAYSSRKCGLWAHLECTGGSRYYIWHNCDESD